MMVLCAMKKRDLFGKTSRTIPQNENTCVCQNKPLWPTANSPCYSLSFQQTRSLAPSTPLTGRRYLKEKDPSITPVSTATQSVSRLQNLLSGRKTCPSDTLLELFK